MCIMGMQVPLEARSELYNSWTGVTDGSEPPHGCWVPNMDPSQEQQVLLTNGPSL